MLLCFAGGRSLQAQGTVPQLPHLLRSAALAYDATGNLFLADPHAHRVFEATVGGKLVVFAGNGTQGFAGDGGAAANAELNAPQGLAVGGDGTVYIADTGNERIRAVSSTGTISTVAGTGIAGAGGDGSSGTAGTLRGPTALAVDGHGALLICDTRNHRVRKLERGMLLPFAGNGVQGFGGDGAAAVQAQLDSPQGLAVAPDGRVFVADTGSNRVRVVDSAGNMATMAGNGSRGYLGDGGSAAAAALASPRGLAVEADGTLLIADSGNQRVRAVSASGVISTLSGSGVEGGSPDGTPAANAHLRTPRAIGLSTYGFPVVADSLNGTARLLTPQGNLYEPAALSPARVPSSVVVQSTVTTTYGEGALPASVSGAVGTPQGKLSLVEAGTPFATANTARGGGAVSLGELSAGTHHLQLIYAGDGLNPAATSPDLMAVVAPAVLAVVPASAVAIYGMPLPALTGSVSGILPRDGGQVNVTFTPAEGDILLGVGTHALAPVLSGARSSNYTVGPTATAGQLRVLPATSAVDLRVPSASYAGLPAQITATVRPQGRGQPTGTVQLLEGGTVLVQTALNGGTAALQLAVPAAGVHSVTAQYLGDGNFLPSASSVAPFTVSAMPDFSVQSAIPSATAMAGSTASFVVAVAGAPGPFTGAVEFGVSGLPSGMTASFSPPAIVPGSGAVPVTVSIHTTAAGPSQAALVTRPSGMGPGSATFCAAVTFFLLPFASARRRASLGGLSVLALLLTGCGARVARDGSGDGVLSRTYSLQLTATATNLAGATVVHTLPLSLTVRN